MVTEVLMSTEAGAVTAETSGISTARIYPHMQQARPLLLLPAAPLCGQNVQA